MAKEGHAEIAVLIDRSGSMDGLEDVVCKGFNTFLWQQVCANGTANLTLALFDDRFDLIHDGVSINEVPALDTQTYYVEGSTSLYDSLGRTIKRLEARINAQPESERPETVIVAVTTDGYENTSVEWDAKMVRDLIESKKAEGWEFLYISAIEEDHQAELLGYDPTEISYYEKDEDGTFDSYLEMSTKTLEYRRQS